MVFSSTFSSGELSTSWLNRHSPQRIFAQTIISLWCLLLRYYFRLPSTLEEKSCRVRLLLLLSLMLIRWTNCNQILAGNDETERQVKKVLEHPHVNVLFTPKSSYKKITSRYGNRDVSITNTELKRTGSNIFKGGVDPEYGLIG